MRLTLLLLFRWIRFIFSTWNEDLNDSKVSFLCNVVAKLPSLQTLEFDDHNPSTIFHNKFMEAFYSHPELSDIIFTRKVWLECISRSIQTVLVHARADRTSVSPKTITLLSVESWGHKADWEILKSLSNAGVKIKHLDFHFSPNGNPDIVHIRVSQVQNLTIHGLEALILRCQPPGDQLGVFNTFLGHQPALVHLTLGSRVEPCGLGSWNLFPVMNSIVKSCGRSGWSTFSVRFQRTSSEVGFRPNQIIIGLLRERSHDGLDVLNEICPDLERLHISNARAESNKSIECWSLSGSESPVHLSL